MKINWKAIPDAFRVVGKAMERNKSTILVGAGILGWIGTAVLVGRAAPKAQTAIRKEQKDKAYLSYDEENAENHELTPIEKVKATWQYYIPAAMTGITSSAAIIWAHKIDLSKVASLMGTYQLTKTELKQLKDKIVEKDGEEKLKDYQKSVHSDVLSTNIGPTTDIYNTGKGTTIFYDPTSDKLFYHDIWKVERALMHMVDGCKNEGTYNLNELRDDLDLPRIGLLSDFAFYYESVKDITSDNVHDLFEYHGLDPENGDSRPVIWLNIEDRVFNTCDMGGDSPFRRKRY